MEDDTPIKPSNVIKGPWKRVKVVSKSETDKVTEDMVFIDEVAETIMIPTIHNLAENGVDIKDEEGMTALYRAAHKIHFKLIQSLTTI